MGTDIILWIQQFSSPVLDALFQGVTMLGEEFFFILALTLVYWCIDKKYGAQLSYVFFLSMFLNSALKVTFLAPRPVGIEGVRTLREHTATGHSFPSGHTQSTATFWYHLMILLKKKWFTALAVIIIILMALSRMYLGVHWLRDVAAAVVFAVLFVHLGRFLYEKSFTSGRFLIPLLIGAAVIPFVFVVQDKDFTTLAGILAGASLGFSVEQTRIGFVIPEPVLLRLRNYLLGLFMLLLIKEGGKFILPEASWADLIRYLLIGFWATAGAPWVFTLIKKNN